MHLLLANAASAMGGAEWSLAELAAALSRRGTRVTVACPDGPLFDRLVAEGLTVRAVPGLRLKRPRLAPRTWFSCFALPRAAAALARIVREAAPDVVVANSLGAALALRPADRRVPVVWTVRDLALPPAAVRLAAQRARSLVAISPAVASRLGELLPGDSRVIAILNGIDLARFAVLPDAATARRRLGLPPAAPLVGMLAHAAPWKRHDLFIAAAARVAGRCSDARFVIGGADLFGEHAGYLSRLAAQAASAGLAERLVWLGRVESPVDFLAALDVLAHPASAEPFGRVICEAMAAGTAVVAVDAAGPQAIIEPGRSGWLVPPDDAAAMADAIAGLLEDDVARRRLAEAARERVRQAFDIARTAGELEALCRRLA